MSESPAIPLGDDRVIRRYELAPQQGASLPPTLPGRGLRRHPAPDSQDVLGRYGHVRDRPTRVT